MTASLRTARFAVLDFETTGLSPRQGAEIVETGAVRFGGEGSGDTFSRLSRPRNPIPPMATRIHNITDDMVAGEPPFAEILPELLSFLGDRIVVAHNAPFDLGFLRAAMASAGLPPLSNLVLDTVQLSRRVHPASPNHRLDFLCHHHDIFREAGHRALDDALATTELLRILLEAAPSEVLDEYSELVEARA